MIQIGLFADVHIHPYARFSGVTEQGLNTWVEQALKVLRQVYDSCREHNVSNVFCLGDLFHVSPRLYTRGFNEVFEFFAARQEEGFKTYLIAGNHDQVARGSAESCLRPLRSVVEEVIETPFVWKFGDHPILCVPYTEDADEVHRLVGRYCALPGGPKVVIGHLAVQGAVVGLAEFQPHEELDPGVFEYTYMTYLGHYHKRQLVTLKTRYIGSVMSTDFHDAFEEKGFTLISIDGDSVQDEFVPIESTRFVVFEAGPLLDSQLSDGDVEGCIVRIDYTGDFDEDVTRQLLLKRGATAVVFNRKAVHEVEERVVKEDGSEVRLEDHLQAWVDKNGEGFDKEKLLKLGADIVHTGAE